MSDRENALYTSELVRYRAGLSSIPPPPRPEPRADDLPQIVGAAPAPVEETAPAPPDADDAVVADASARTLERDSSSLDDGSLDDFVRDLVSQSATTAAPDDLPAMPDTPLAPADLESGAELPAGRPAARASEDQATREPGPVRRVIGWLGGLFGGADEKPKAPPREAAPRSVPDSDLLQQPPPAKPQASALGRVHRPTLKPSEFADPPAPAPAKPLAAATLPIGVPGLAQTALATTGDHAAGTCLAPQSRRACRTAQMRAVGGIGTHLVLSPAVDRTGGRTSA